MSIDNTDDIIDSRDIIDRIEELESELLDCFNEQQETEGFTVSDDSEEIYKADSVEDDLFINWLADCKLEESSEYKSLKALAKEAENQSSDWSYGETLIRRSYFVEYVQDMLADCGTIPKDVPWFVEIDWDATAKNIESDYASVDFDGVEYLIRSC